MKAVWNNRVIARSDNVIELDGVYYFPVSSLNSKYFLKSSTRSRCPWKGLASYMHLVINRQVNEDAAWYYPVESDCPDILKNRVAFWKGVEIRDVKKVNPRFPAIRSILTSFF